ncbi:hypothetical protein [Streptomyces spectabilis]|uniref:Uncharacterized protein n=1 Tax=Streptomyces spectabilis TaxID=68270 RepID=A0A5P2X1G4_STRST|nr:hypothetical protein [Streptomyces spectabilis]MBB5101548.1 hypothetical protein [Streptomyces spectabilis]MCI3900733.1 hypothetical protein [Streptomyces spectabilis]QEV58271.1 hypothetical protein CP982_05735 [Streptomyces spectabilis]
MKLRSLTAAGITLAVTCTTMGLGGAGIASASTTSAKNTKNTRACVQILQKGKSKPSKPTCYENYRAAIAAATNRGITDAPVNAREAATNKTFQARLARLGKAAPKGQAAATGETPYLLAQLFTEANFGGTALVYMGAQSCERDNGTDYQRPYVGDEFNDAISAVKTYSDCRANLHEDRDFQGANIGWLYGEWSYVGDAMNDRTSSIELG